MFEHLLTQKWVFMYTFFPIKNAKIIYEKQMVTMGPKVHASNSITA